MSRPVIATMAGIAFVLIYILAAITLPERIPAMPWPVEAAYWCAAGLLWVLPIRWLMLWSVGKR